MPVVELNINRIKKLVSGNVTRKQILDVLPFLGLDIESEVGDEIRLNTVQIDLITRLIMELRLVYKVYLE